MKTALITGITGQDGAYLAEFLLRKGYVVHSAYRRSSSVNFWRIEELGIRDHKNLRLVELDLTDMGSMIRLMSNNSYDEVYNLAAQSFVGVSFEQPVTTTEINAVGPLNILEAIRTVKPDTKYYQASTSEMFGKVQETPQRESTPFYPRSPYGVAKLYGHWITVNYREAHDIFACSGILFNHESPLRGEEFVTRKISKAVAAIRAGKQECLYLGNLDAKRDWGFAKDYVEGMWLMMQHNTPDTYVLATGETITVREFVREAFAAAGMTISFHDSGLNEYAIDAITQKVVVRINPQFYRPAEVDLLVGDYSKAKNVLGWTPKTRAQELCQEMVYADLYRQGV